MNIDELLLSQNSHWRVDFKVNGVKRALYDEFVKNLNSRAVFAITGARRAGKSFFLHQIIQHLIQENVSPDNILNINFEHPFFVEKNNVEIISQIYNSFLEIKNPQGKIYFFLDEPQNIKGWESFVRFNYDDNAKIKFFVTGSNSKLLSSEFATKLTGRVFNFSLPLFNFREFLDFFKIKYEKGKSLLEIYEKNYDKRQILVNYAEKFLESGGFPEIYDDLNPETLDLYARNYVKTVLYADIVPRFDIRNSAILENLFYQIANNNGSYFSFNSLSKTLGISDLTVKQYVSYLEESFLIHILPRFSEKSKEQIRDKQKIYLLDPVLKKPYHSRSFDDKARDVENLILRNLGGKAQKFYLQKKSEIDFFVKTQGETYLLNSCYSDEIPERERVGFLQFSGEFKKSKKIIISKNVFQKKPILTVPLWTWLLFW